MARLFFKSEGTADISCANPSCLATINRDIPHLYDELQEQHFCDTECLQEYADANPEQFVKYYAENNIYEVY